MITLPKALESLQAADFASVLRKEIQKLGIQQLPLQAGLSQTSCVSDSAISVLILKITETADLIRAKTGIFYAGINAGSCCADDPTPVCEQTEYCEIQFEIDKTTAQATLTLLTDDH